MSKGFFEANHRRYTFISVVHIRIESIRGTSVQPSSCVIQHGFNAQFNRLFEYDA